MVLSSGQGGPDQARNMGGFCGGLCQGNPGCFRRLKSRNPPVVCCRSGSDRARGSPEPLLRSNRTKDWPPMRLEFALLADAAIASPDGKLGILGGGWEVIFADRFP